MNTRSSSTSTEPETIKEHERVTDKKTRVTDIGDGEYIEKVYTEFEAGDQREQDSKPTPPKDKYWWRTGGEPSPLLVQSFLNKKPALGCTSLPLEANPMANKN